MLTFLMLLGSASLASFCWDCYRRWRMPLEQRRLLDEMDG